MPRQSACKVCLCGQLPVHISKQRDSGPRYDEMCRRVLSRHKKTINSIAIVILPFAKLSRAFLPDAFPFGELQVALILHHAEITRNGYRTLTQGFPRFNELATPKRVSL